ncbi:hypothetical protein TW81_10820 [Vibrio galatheae]|uniref:Uncharacterized protein n=1 Tax=Vibrio galatheae TaxID=579748 RepID=A0A0F4NL09_9VIBR|nr:hypothetical protein [Vibrio galatheae]KJY82711.1 hypothetical protein TW81_10820 [Vibrio galatheae]
MFWIAVLAVITIGTVAVAYIKQKEKILWQGECPPTTFSYRDQSDRQRITVTPIKIRKIGNYVDLIALNSSGNEKVYFSQLVDSMLSTEGHEKKHFDDRVNDVLLSKETA